MVEAGTRGHRSLPNAFLPLRFYPMRGDSSAARPFSSRESHGASHDEKVVRVCRQLARRDETRPVSLRKKSTSHQVPKARDAKYSDDLIDIGDLNAILHVDPAARTCVAEAGVTFVDLVGETMRHGLVPVVVPELKTITIGGAVSGCSLESTSFKYGGFHDTCLEYEVITATGQVLVCTPENENQLMFQMMHGTFGTLGILSKLTFRLIPAKPFVKVVYEKYRRLSDYMAAIRRHCDAEDVDFMDGIVHRPDELVLSVGTFVAEAPYANHYDWMKIYYLSTRERSEDYLRTEDYLFRYDRGVTNVHPKSWLGRLFLGKFLDSSQLLRLAEKANGLLPSERPDVTLDVFIPFSRVSSFLAWYEAEFRHFPLWCVPYRRVRDYAWLSPSFYEGLDDELFLDLAVYGMKQPPGSTNYYKLMEDKLLEIGGLKTLISHNYYSEADFWKTWNRVAYEEAKAIGDPNNIFRDLYTKTCMASQGREQGRQQGREQGREH
jgi:FAD/FMN-containing dehydrogenase